MTGTAERRFPGDTLALVALPDSDHPDESDAALAHYELAAQQTADWGALLGPGDTLPIRIFQLSALIGRGAPASVTLEF